MLAGRRVLRQAVLRYVAARPVEFMREGAGNEDPF
jgi:hypothetical protein